MPSWEDAWSVLFIQKLPFYLPTVQCCHISTTTCRGMTQINASALICDLCTEVTIHLSSLLKRNVESFVDLCFSRWNGPILSVQVVEEVKCVFHYFALLHLFLIIMLPPSRINPLHYHSEVAPRIFLSGNIYIISVWCNICCRNVHCSTPNYDAYLWLSPFLV